MQLLTFLFLQVGMHYVVNDDGQMMKQDVGLNYRGHYIKINTAARDGQTSATIIHHTREVKFNIISILYCNLKSLHILLLDMTT